MNMYCLDAGNGVRIWNTTLGGDVYSSPAVGPEKLAVGCNDGRIYLLDRDIGSIIWSREMGSAPLESSPVLTEDSVIVTYEQGMAVLDISNGSASYSFEYGDCGESSPALMNGRIYYGDRLGFVRCIAFTSINPPDNETGNWMEAPSSIVIAAGISFVVIIMIIVLAILFRAKQKRL
jgi:outer membrane protein assembly factor BamB